MHLYCFFLYRRNIKGLKAVDQCYGNYRAFSVDRTFKGSSLKFQDFISLPASGPFRKNKIIPALLHLFCHLVNEFHGTAYVFSVHGQPMKQADYLFYEYNICRLFFYYHTKGMWISLNDRQYIKQSLMIWKHDKAILLRQIRAAMDLYGDTAALIYFCNNIS